MSALGGVQEVAAVGEQGADNVLRVLSEIEALPADATGALAFGPETSMSGVVLLERGRVCWAAAQGLRRRLTDLLRERCQPQLTNDEVEAVVQRCKQTGTPVGESLVADGRLTADALRATLLRHTVESLAAGVSWRAAPRWLPHRARGYQSAFTFQPAELLAFAHTIAVDRGELEAAERRLASVGQAHNAAAFDMLGVHLLACRLPEEGTAAVTELRAAGTWAARSLAADAERSAVLKFAFDGHGGSWLGWRDGGMTFVAHCRDRDAFSSLMRELQRQGWTSAVHSTVPYVGRAAQPSPSP